MNPLISFVVPVFNVEEYLEQCVSSILNQTYRNIEVILVDDGSTDNSGNICDSFSKTDKRVHVIHKSNGGLSSARNAGLRVVSGKYLIFTDSDDFVSPKMAETMFETISSTDSDLVLCGFAYTDEAGNVTTQFNEDNTPGEYKTDFLLSRIAAGWTFGAIAWNKLYRKELFDNLWFAEGKISEDEYIAHRLLARVMKAVIIPDVFCFYRQRTGSIINSSFNPRKLNSLDAFIDRVEFFISINEQKLAYISLATAMRNLADLWQYRKTGNEVCTLLCSYRTKLTGLCKSVGKQDVQTRYVFSVSLFRLCFPLYLLMRKIREAKG